MTDDTTKTKAGGSPLDGGVRPLELAEQLKDCARRIDLGPNKNVWMPPDVELMRRAASLLEAASAVGIQQEQTIMDQEREIARLRAALQGLIDAMPSSHLWDEPPPRLSDLADALLKAKAVARDALHGA